MKNIKIEFLKEQNIAAREMTLKILNQTPDDLWYHTPKVINSNIAWQVGHMIVSQYYHTIAVIAKPNPNIFEDVPLKDYFPIYSMYTESTLNDLSPSPITLLKELKIITKYSNEILDKLTDVTLNDPLEATRHKHPLAKTKFEALSWNIKHEMWHLGQISMIKRIIGVPTKWY